MQVVLVQIPATTATCICLISLFSRVIPKKKQKKFGAWPLQARCPSCHPTNSIKNAKSWPEWWYWQLMNDMPKAGAVKWVYWWLKQAMPTIMQFLITPSTCTWHTVLTHINRNRLNALVQLQLHISDNALHQHRCS